MKHLIYISITVLVAMSFQMTSAAGQSMNNSARSNGQTLYIPSYSHVYFGDNEREFNLSSTLLIRNVSQSDTIAITRVEYYDTEGNKVRDYLEQPRRLVPLQSAKFIVRESDRSGGAGANFIVEWHAEYPVLPPITETVNIGTAYGQGISFVKDGIVLRESRAGTQ